MGKRISGILLILPSTLVADSVRWSQRVEGPPAIEARSGLRLFVRKPVRKSPVQPVASEFGFHAFHPVDLFSSLGEVFLYFP